MSLRPIFVLAMVLAFGCTTSAPQSPELVLDSTMPGENASHSGSGGHPCSAAQEIATNLSTLSGGESLAIVRSDRVLVKSLQDPLGEPVQLSSVDLQTGAVSIVGTLPASVQNSDGSGIAIDPTTGDVVLIDEQFAQPGSRIASVDLDTLQMSTLFAIPWVTNPHSNGSGQEQFAFDPGHAGVLYVWDSTLATLFKLDEGSGTLTSLVALEPSIGAGFHETSKSNHIAFDPRTGTILLTDAASYRVLEVDPTTSPATVTTLFDGLSEAPHAIALRKNKVFVEAGFDAIYSGRRHGGTMKKVADGFTALTDIAVVKGHHGTALLAVDKGQDALFRVTRCPHD
jgi:hypothetical protein